MRLRQKLIFLDSGASWSEGPQCDEASRIGEWRPRGTGIRSVFHVCPAPIMNEYLH